MILLCMWWFVGNHKEFIDSRLNGMKLLIHVMITALIVVHC